MWMPLGGQVNTLKGKQTERKCGQKLFLAAEPKKWGLGREEGLGCGGLGVGDQSVTAGAC